MANTDLTTIQQKVRRLTRTPAESQLTTADLNQYINTAVLYDFPEHLRLFNLRKLLTFYTQPNVDTYVTSNDPLNPLYQFKDRCIAIHPPVFLAGIQGFFTQWRDVFYGYYPQTATVAMSGLVGDGTTGPFNGTIYNSPSVQGSININCLDTNGNAMILVDQAIDNINGYLGIYNNTTQTPVLQVYGTINYITGAFSCDFPNATQAMAPIYVENLGYQPGKPLAVLYYNDTFTIRPVPDKVYSIEFEIDVQPTELLANNQSPDLAQWWQYISYLAAKKIFEDRMDLESVQQLMPELNKQERLVLRTTLTQQANERTVTIYTQGKNYGFGWFGPGGWPY